MGLVRVMITLLVFKPILCSVLPTVMPETKGAEGIACASDFMTRTKICGEIGQPMDTISNCKGVRKNTRGPDTCGWGEEKAQNG